MTLSRRQIAQTALSIALAYAGAGTHEEGGNNRGDQVEFFQHMMGGNPGDPWCADFVSTCLVKAFARLSGLPEDRAHLPGYVHDTSVVLFSLSGYCPALATAAASKGLLKPAEFAAVAGDLVLFHWDGTGEPHHVGFVRRAPLAGRVLTVEGNTESGDAGSQGDGGGVYLRDRGLDVVYGFVHFE